MVDGVQLREVSNQVIEEHPAVGDGAVLVERRIDQPLGVCHLLGHHLDLHRGGLGLLELVDEALVLEDVALRFREELEHGILDLPELRGRLRAGEHEGVLFLLDGGAFNRDEACEQLHLE